MRELTVYYCSKCGRYGFYQVSKNAICPVCKTPPMTVFPMSYQNFMDMDYNMRDQLISDQIAGNVTPQTSVVQRLTEQSKTSNSRSAIAKLKARNEELEYENLDLHQKNAELEKTIDWMHDMIWDLTRKLHGNANE